MGRMSRKAERAAWTAAVEGRDPEKAASSKYKNEKQGKYASIHECEVAGGLAALERAGKIHELREQVRFVLVEGDGIERAVTYIADFTYSDETGFHVLDAKGFKTAVYRLKKRLMWLLLKIRIEEV